MTTKCPHCGQLYEVDEQSVGQIAHCEKCDKDFEIPPRPILQKKDTKTSTSRIPKALLWKLVKIIIAVCGCVSLFLSIRKATVTSKESTFLACQRAAELGDAEAQFTLGWYYHNGEGVDKEYTHAVYWWRQAAEQGLAEAQYNLGVCYHFGEGVDKDMTQAVYWWRKAAEQGDAHAQFDLGVCYENGEGVDKDHTQAVYWCRKAAEQGLSEAKQALEELQREGKL